MRTNTFVDIGKCIRVELAFVECEGAEGSVLGCEHAAVRTLHPFIPPSSLSDKVLVIDSSSREIQSSSTTLLLYWRLLVR